MTRETHFSKTYTETGHTSHEYDLVSSTGYLSSFGTDSLVPGIMSLAGRTASSIEVYSSSLLDISLLPHGFPASTMA
jgi:hypothetical protein